VRRADIVTAARGWVGTPYHHQASRRGVGCDCLGLVRGVWRDVLGEEPEAVPAYSPQWAEGRGEETLLAAAHRHFVPADAIRAGTLLLFRWKARLPAKHCGIATGPDTFVHAYDAAGRAVEGRLAPVWRGRIAGAFDFPGVTD
jgi:NlpC/P60 family putative phage cell wall peptidase